MALSLEERKLAETLKLSGKTNTDVFRIIAKRRAGEATPLPDPTALPKPSGFAAAVRDIPSDLQEGFKGAVDATTRGMETADQVQDDVFNLKTSPGLGTLRTIGGGLRAGAEVVGNAFLTIGKLFTSPRTEQTVKGKVEETALTVAQMPEVQALIKKYQSLPPEQQQAIDGFLGTAEGFTTMFGVGPATSALRTGIREAGSAAARGGGYAVESGQVLLNGTASGVKSLFSRPAKSIDDAVQQADQSVSQSTSISNNVDVRVNVPETKVDIDSVNVRLDQLIAQGKTAEARALAESTAPQLTLTQKWAGIRPDIKQRIQGKQDLLREYFDIAHARNSNDTLPSVYEYGGNYARQAEEAMAKKLSETGGDIGAVRTKLATVQAPRQAVEEINNSFAVELKKLNLHIVNGKVQQIPGTQSRVQAAGDVRVLQELHDELKIMNQSPTLTNLIDVRTNFDGKINFAKGQREVSNSVDPLSRRVRTVIADKAAQIVGRSNAADLKKYSNFMEAYNDIRSYTDRKAGGEYLLRLVLSGRGGEARQIIQTIKEHTGIDLMDHATMMQISNELIGNDAQKNLFRQEVTKAGLDAGALLRGDPTGAMATLFQKSVDRILDPEKIFLEAAK